MSSLNKMEYSKLVRDNIPEIIRRDNQIPITHSASPGEYQQKSLDKLQEELTEFYLTESTDELVDIIEVIYSIAESRGINRQKFNELIEQKRKERGGVEKRIILDEIK